VEVETLHDFVMPSLGADMTEGTLVEWRVGPGDQVKRGDIVACVDTSKAEIEIEVFQDGIVAELLIDEGTKVGVGTPIARIRPADGAPAEPPAPVAEPPAPVAEPPAPPAPVAEPPAPPVRPPAATPEHHLRISPIARRIAEERGVDLARVQGTGPHGAILKADVEAAAEGGVEPVAPAAPPTPRPSPAPSTEERQRAMREAIGALMARSKREIPHYHLAQDIDMSTALEWVEARNADRSAENRIVAAAVLLKAAAAAVAEVPEMNGFWVDGAFQRAESVHLGVAVSLRGGGLIAPALHDAQTKPVDQLMSELKDLVRRARRGALRASEMSDPTLTVTNLGDQGVDLVHGVIYPPQVALVGFGRIRPRPWAAGEMLGVHPVLTATLAADHRASDGHRGGLYLARIDALLQQPDLLEAP
jgi:pyruvate dehydrogenase E2 component (dihydrolipoamide acetyltransferase)